MAEACNALLIEDTRVVSARRMTPFKCSSSLCIAEESQRPVPCKPASPKSVSFKDSSGTQKLETRPSMPIARPGFEVSNAG